MTTLRALTAAFLILATYGLSIAGLPAPPSMDDKAKAAAEEKKAKDAATAEAVKAQQAKAEDRVAARYIAEQKTKGKIVTPQMGPTMMTVAAPVSATPGVKSAEPAATKTAAPASAKK